MIKAQVKTQKTAAALRRLASGLSSRTVPNRQAAVQLTSWVLNNFEQSGALQPKPWDPLAASTVKQKTRKGLSLKPLYGQTGNLRQSFAGFATNDLFGVGARASFGVDYAEVHEYGSDNVPSRPMLPPEKVAVDYGIRIYDLFIKQRAKSADLPLK